MKELSIYRIRLALRVFGLRPALLALIVGVSAASSRGQSLSPNPQTQSISPLPAETASNPGNEKDPANAPAAATNGTQLQKVVVEATSPDATTLPTRPTDAVTGLGDTVQDTPRAIYQVSKLQLQFDPISNATDLARYAPSVSSVTSQGIAGVPYIRGFSAEVYQDGFRIGRSLRPFDATTSYQSLDIVTGPAPVIYGPSSKTSGFIDWTTKEPFFDANHTQVDLLFGTFNADGGGRSNFYQQVDNSGPIGKDLAYRVVYKQTESDSYFQGASNNSEHLYAALTWVPTKNITVDWNFDFGNYDYSLVRGYNRVTQGLIDNNQYTGGTATPVLRYGTGAGTVYYEPIQSNPNGPNLGYRRVAPSTVTPGGEGTPTISNYYPVAGAVNPPARGGTLMGFVLRPADATTTTLSPSIGAENPNDPARLSQYLSEQKVSIVIDDEFQILNKSYYEHDDQHQQTFDDASLQGDQADIFENRTEFRLDKNYQILGVNIEHKSNSGIDVRVLDDVTVFNVSNYLINPFDLSQPLSNLTLGNLNGVSEGAIFNNKGTIVSPGYGPIALAAYNPITGFQSPIAGPVSPTTFESRMAEIGLYTFHEFKFNDQWTWNIGGRGTLTYVHDTSPVRGSALAASINDHSAAIEPSVSTSLSYKPAPWTTLYASYNYTQAYNEGNGAGGVSYGTGNKIPSAALHSDSVLYETGAKFEIIPNQLFASIAGYDQTRTLPGVATLGGYVYPRVEAHGFEGAINYQPNKNLSLGMNYSWLEANYINFNPNSSFGSPYGILANGTTVFSATGASPTESTYPRGNYRVMLPKNRVDAFATYQFDFGLGFRADLWATDSYPTVNNVATIPAEFNLNLGVFYAQPRWRVQVDFLNVTNEENFALINSDTAENIQPLEPFAVQAKFSYTF